MKKILILAPTEQTRKGHMNWLAFRDALRERLTGEVQVEMAAIKQLTFVLDGQKTRIYDAEQNFDVADFDLVVFRTIGKLKEEAIAIAAYCRSKNIKYIDGYIPKIGINKLSCAFIRWEHDLPVPETVYGPAESVFSQVSVTGLPAVLKASDGKKGRDNYLVNSPEAIQEILSSNPEKTFVLQKFIANDGDLRLVVLNDRVRLIISRQAQNSTHLNNTSQGGKAELIPLESVPPDVIELALQATKLEQLSVSGVDIIEEQNSGRYYILEVNRAPQIGTGEFVDEKLEAYARALAELVELEVYDAK